MNKKVLPISGTWFDFHHCNPYEGDYWNHDTYQFTESDWDKKIEEMVEAGMDTFILLSVALHGETFYPSEVIKRRWNLKCDDPLEAVLNAADRLKVHIYIGLGFFTSPAFHDFGNQDNKYRVDIIQELVDKYGHHPSFSGWYLPVEAGINGHFPKGYIRYVNAVSNQCRKLGPTKIVIAPYGTRTIQFDTQFEYELKALDVDFIAYQDEVGVNRSKPEELHLFYAQLREVHDRVSKPLWADMEVFKFQGKRLIPAPFERVRNQLEVLSNYVDKLLCYQYLGLMNKPESVVHAGHETSVDLYENYMNYLKEMKIR